MIVSESGMYDLIFQSRSSSAREFQKWVTTQVLPQIRKSGQFGEGSGTPSFVRRFNENWSRTDQGFFSVISELYVRLYGRFEQEGHVLPDRGIHGRQLRPDNSVGRGFSDWLKMNYPKLVQKRKKYRHLLPEGFTIEAYQYPNDMLELFIRYVETIWLRQKAEGYFSDKDPVALDYLPRLLPHSQN
jgi:hypothetical protein